MQREYTARRIEVEGIVQGVGFRPFVYQLAIFHNLKGEVLNTSAGVSIHVEGIHENIESFSRDLSDKKPLLARVTSVSNYPEKLKNFADFSIIKSKIMELRSALISPDVSICDDCIKELFAPQDRRFQYPFINCTNCGPRYTIIGDIPYDRPNTSMKNFRMCAKCQAEYDDPGNRRFHAQPNACHDCGPSLTLYDNNRKMIDDKNTVATAAGLLKQGLIVAIKGLGGFHLAADAENDKAVYTLRKKKLREEKPFAIMSFDMERIKRFAVVEPDEEILLSSYRRPIVLLKKKEPNSLSLEVSPRNKYFGTMLPYTPLHYLLLRHDFTALVMTSGNRSEEPISIDNEDAFNRFSDIADFYLTHNRDIYLRSDDSITKRTAGATRFIRRSRGYVPEPVFLSRKIDPVLACGAEMKNTICITRDNKAFLSQHIGDLENLSTLDFFELTIRHMKRILDVDPEIVACDLHPDYLSTKYALSLKNVKVVRVQHHHAHIAGCMAENMAEGPVIGLSFDGTGYGEDGKIWGGEILIAEKQRFTRAAHISYIPMPGSVAAIREPWRMAASYLYDAFGEEIWGLDLPVLKEKSEDKIRFIIGMITKKINSPETSSLGRLFDGISAILGIRQHVCFEGQAAMELEMLSEENSGGKYDYEWISDDNVYKILTAPIIKGVVSDLHNGITPSVIGGKFHGTVICLYTELCKMIRKDTDIEQIALSGGAFQNSILLSGMIKSLEENRFKVYSHKFVPSNDGGISLGQAMIAGTDI
ncbi:MAG: hydrogenase maturation protein HypF [Thermodesulfobacteriota bacterium]|nr:hydrogenase maturation protein HypF [Thermodesulfobacteriota bacterium]